MTLLVNNRPREENLAHHQWTAGSKSLDLERGTAVDIRIWRKASEAGPEENRKILVSLGSCIMHHPELYEALRRSLGDWAAKPGPRCGVDEMHQSGDLRQQAASDFVRLLTERGITAAVYCIPDERVHQLVIRVLFAERPCIDERVAVGDAMADLLDLHPTLSVDLMTLDPREAYYCPLPEHAVRVDTEAI